MKICQTPFVITISHQIGSSGAAIGQNLSERLGIPMIDHEILEQVAQKLHLAEAEVENREEQLTSFWQTFGRMMETVNPIPNLAVDTYIPSDEELFQIESETICRIAEHRQAIFIGRCCRYILRNVPCHFSLLVLADRSTRIQRLCALYRISEQDAGKMIATNDRERTRYIQTFTKQDWLDARLYDLCLNTTSVGVNHACEIVDAAVRAKLVV